MNVGTAVVLAIVVVICVLAAHSVFKKKGGCDCGCSGDPESPKCSGCEKNKVYGINIDAEGMPMDCSCPHCKECK